VLAVLHPPLGKGAVPISAAAPFFTRSASAFSFCMQDLGKYMHIDDKCRLSKKFDKCQDTVLTSSGTNMDFLRQTKQQNNPHVTRLPAIYCGSSFSFYFCWDIGH
jgi:hypothetical protein